MQTAPPQLDREHDPTIELLLSATVVIAAHRFAGRPQRWAVLIYSTDDTYLREIASGRGYRPSDEVWRTCVESALRLHPEEGLAS